MVISLTDGLKFIEHEYLSLRALPQNKEVHDKFNNKSTSHFHFHANDMHVNSKNTRYVRQISETKLTKYNNITYNITIFQKSKSDIYVIHAQQSSRTGILAYQLHSMGLFHKGNLFLAL